MSTQSTRSANGPVVVSPDFLGHVVTCFDNLKPSIISALQDKYKLTEKQIESVLNHKPVRKDGLYDFQKDSIRDEVQIKFECSWKNGYTAKFSCLDELCEELKFEPSLVEDLEINIGSYGKIHASFSIREITFSSPLKYQISASKPIIHSFNADIERAILSHKPDTEFLYSEAAPNLISACAFFILYITVLRSIPIYTGKDLTTLNYLSIFLVMAAPFSFLLAVPFNKQWEKAFPKIDWKFNNINDTRRKRRLMWITFTLIVAPIIVGVCQEIVTQAVIEKPAIGERITKGK